MSGSRAQLAADMAPHLPGYAIIPDPRTLDNLDPALKGTVQIVRTTLEWNPTAPQAQNLEGMYVWVVTHQHEQPAAEDDLDELLDEVLDAIAALGDGLKPKGERMQHPNGHHAYRVTLPLITQKEQ